MKKFKMLLSVMALGVLLITNVVPVSAAEKIQSTKIESLSELDLDTYTQELMEADVCNSHPENYIWRHLGKVRHKMLYN